MKNLNLSSTGLIILAISYPVSSIIIPIPNQLIYEPSFNTSLSIPPLTAGPKFVLNGKYGAESIPSIPVLMDAVSGLADLAHLDSQRRIRGFHVPTLPPYPNIDISLQPAAQATDFEALHAVFGLYCVMYNMITSGTFRNSTFSLEQDGVSVVQIQISKRGKPKYALDASHGPMNISTSQNSSMSDDTRLVGNIGGTGLEYFFELYDEPEEAIKPQDVFVTVMATLKNIALSPATDVVSPFRSGAKGSKVRFQCLQMEDPRKEPPFLLYANLIETIKVIPAYMLRQKMFARMFIIISFASDIIGEAVLEKGSPDPPGPNVWTNHDVSIA